MSDSDRSERVALVTVVCTVLVFLIGLAAGGAFGSREALDDPIGQPNTDAAEPYQEQRGPSEGYWWPEVSARDTYAQWAMSIFALIATVTGIVGIVWIRQTLDATRDTANAAIDGNRTAREIGEAQSRAYIAVSNFEITDFVSGKTPKIQFTVKNTGNSPAFGWECRPTLAYAKSPETHKFISDFTGWDGTVFDIPSGAKTFQYFDLDDLTEGQRSAILRGEYAPVVYGHGRYRDVFGHLRRFVFCYYFKPENLKDGRAHLWPTRRHNRNN